MRALLAIVLASLTLAAGLGAARGQTPAADKELVAQAKAYIRVGVRAVKGKQYQVAIAAFEEAYRLVPELSTRYALAIAYRYQWAEDHDPAKLKRAVTLFREVMADPDEDPLHPRQPKTQKLLLELEPALAAVEAEQAKAGAGPIVEAVAEVRTALILSSRIKGTRVRLDDDPQVFETPVVVETTPGPHRIAAFADGYYTSSQDALAMAGESPTVEVVLEARPATLTVRSADNAAVVVDGRRAGPANHELSIPAGNHVIAVVAPGRHTWSQALTLGRGDDFELDAPLHKTRKRRAVPWVLGASAALLIGGGAATAGALAAQRAAERYEDLRDNGVLLGPADREAHNDAIDRRDAWRSAALWLFGGAALGGLTALYLYVTDQQQLGEAPLFAVVPGGATASYEWSF